MGATIPCILSHDHVVYCMLKCLIIACINYHLLSKLARQQIAVLQNLTASFTKWIRLPFLAVNFDNLQQVANWSNWVVAVIAQ